MGLRIFSVTGEALHFGGRRMETVARVAWLPLLLSMVASMAAVFAMASVIAGERITFGDIPSYSNIAQQVAKYAGRGFQNDPAAMWSITLASLAAQTLLTASFMAPLIRYAGLGEKPAPGLVRAPFGPDQLRFIFSSLFGTVFVAILVFGPMAAATFYTLKYIVAATPETFASFPDPNSPHTIEIKTAGDQAAAAGRSWVYNSAIPLMAAAPLALLFWALLFFHFAPKNRPNAPARGNVFLRALATLAGAALLLALAYFVFAEAVMTEFRGNMTFLGVVSSIASLGVDMSGVLTGLDFTMKSPSARVLFFGVASFFVMNYLSLRLFAYPAVAVCRKSLAPHHMLAVTRGWNILRLFVIIALLFGILSLVQVYVLNALLFERVLPWVVNILYQATAVSTKLVNSGVTADWVRPLFVWIWNIVKILVNIFWSFFSFGVTAGLYGRLYRENEAGH